MRSGYPAAALIATDFVFASAEARYRAAALPLGWTTCGIEPFLFFDAALLNDQTADRRMAAEGMGAGLRVLFDSPVFAYFTFTFGVNPNGSSRFSFCGTAGIFV